MSFDNWIKKQGLTRRKLAAIGTLAAVFVTVLVYQFGGDAAPPATESEPAAETKVTKRTRQRALSHAAKTAPTKTANQVNPEAWKTIPRQLAMEYDFFSDHSKPQFVEPAASPGTERTTYEEQQTLAQQRAQALTRLKRDGVSFIIKDESGQIAVLGSQLVRVGDIVDGYRVVAIDQNGLALEVADAETN